MVVGQKCVCACRKLPNDSSRRVITTRGIAKALEFLTSGHSSLPASKVTTAEPFPYRRNHLHRQFNKKQTQITMNKLKLSLLNLTTLALLVLTAVVPSSVHADGGAVDTMSLTDEPGNWFKVRSQGRLLRLSEPVKELISKSTIAARVRVIQSRFS
jgi:hypothetical protein